MRNSLFEWLGADRARAADREGDNPVERLALTDVCADVGGVAGLRAADGERAADADAGGVNALKFNRLLDESLAELAGSVAKLRDVHVAGRVRDGA